MGDAVLKTDNEVLSFVVSAIAYLARNDFTSISQIGLRLIRAMDGSRGVYVWLDSTSANHAIPLKLLEMAKAEGRRIDIISVRHLGNMIVLDHHINAVGVD
jgi:hypothetical protein